MNAKPIRAGIVGGSGYTGLELLRLLARHPHARAVCVTSTTHAGRKVADEFPSLRGAVELDFSTVDAAELAQCDVVFSATPNGVAMKLAPGLLDAGAKFIDLSADFRLRDAAVWEKWYGQPHACPGLLGEAVYGLPELHRARIAGARLVANPGCYPTAVGLGFLPLVERGLVDVDGDRGGLIADVKSGVSGAGRKASLTTALGEASDSFKAYAVAGHRHGPEIMQELSAVAGRDVALLFVPHLLPIIRGIHATLYARLTGDGGGDVQALYEARFADEPFVDVLPPGAHPDTRSVRGSNTCRIAVHQPGAGGTVVVLAVIDNLVKGAAGQAVQNMNLMFSLPETAGLEQVALAP